VLRILSGLLGRRARHTGAKNVVPFKGGRSGGSGRSKKPPAGSAGPWRSGARNPPRKSALPSARRRHPGAARLRRGSWRRLQAVLIGIVIFVAVGWFLVPEDQVGEVGVRVISPSGDTTFGDRVNRIVDSDVGVRVIGASGDTTFGGRVTRIVDGDTFHIAGQNRSIRVWGLDAPETDEPTGAAATAELTRLISGQTLQCYKRDIDRYGRIVGQCWLPDGRDITAAMIASGTAGEYCRFSGNHYRTCR
jgi:hypothetical protein